MSKNGWRLARAMGAFASRLMLSPGLAPALRATGTPAVARRRTMEEPAGDGRPPVERPPSKAAPRPLHLLPPPHGGAPGRRALIAALTVALDERAAEAPASVLAVYMLGIAGLAPTDDAGVVDRIASTVRARRAIVRLGPGEFVVVADGLACDADAQALGAAIVEAFRAPFATGYEGADATDGVRRADVGIGYALAPDDGLHAAQLMRRADLAMFEARQSGHGQVVRYDPQDWPICQVPDDCIPLERTGADEFRAIV